MRRFFLSSIIGTTLLATGMHAATVDDRRGYQQGRIAQGVGSGQLTAREMANLERREAGISHEIRHDRLEHNGHLTPGERARIQHQQDVMSHRIYRDKHNAFQR